MRQIGILTGVLLVACTTAQAQVVDTSKGPIEFVGLEQWSPERIQKELGYKTPDSLHYCASELKKRLGFPDASVFTFRAESGQYKVITVVEPQHSHRVRYAETPTGNLGAPATWAPVLAAARLNYGQDFTFELRQYASAALRGTSLDKTSSWMPTLATLRSDEDAAAALKLLAGDQDRVQRMAAAAVLINFPARDDAWQGLVRALRDREDMVIAAAMHALEGLATHRARTVDWEPVAADLRHLLNGTSLFATRIVMRALLNTQVPSRLAPLLVGRDGGHILLAYVRASRVEDRTLAHDLLVALSGQDHGYDAKRWRQWIASAQPPSMALDTMSQCDIS